MIPVHARQQGGAVIMTIPADLVKLLNIKAGDTLNVDVVPGGFITRPIVVTAARRLSLAELLEGVDQKTMAAVNAETAWAREGSPVGRELA
jgi:antitoxin ChpS